MRHETNGVNQYGIHERKVVFVDVLVIMFRLRSAVRPVSPVLRQVSAVYVAAVDTVSDVAAFHPAIGKTVEERFYQTVGKVVF